MIYEREGGGAHLRGISVGSLLKKKGEGGAKMGHSPRFLCVLLAPTD
jgi:hypothetical protein